jgi:hypothetical protein
MKIMGKGHVLDEKFTLWMKSWKKKIHNEWTLKKDQMLKVQVIQWTKS